MGQACLIRRFQEPGTRCTVHRQHRVPDLLGNLHVLLFVCFLHRLPPWRSSRLCGDPSFPSPAPWRSWHLRGALSSLFALGIFAVMTTPNAPAEPRQRPNFVATSRPRAVQGHLEPVIDTCLESPRRHDRACGIPRLVQLCARAFDYTARRSASVGGGSVRRSSQASGPPLFLLLR
jgi:hypothetical protein